MKVYITIKKNPFLTPKLQLNELYDIMYSKKYTNFRRSHFINKACELCTDRCDKTLIGVFFDKHAKKNNHNRLGRINREGDFSFS